MSEKIITFFGSGSAETTAAVYELAYRTGLLLAEAGFTIANGGYGGTMSAAAKGASDAGGKTIGVTCSVFKKSRANEYISREIITHSLDERLNTLIELGQGYVVLPGSTGTLLELAKVWELKNKGLMNKEKPIILMGDFWKPLLELIAAIEPDSRGLLCPAESPEQVSNILTGRFGP